MRRPDSGRGFSLVELMMTVALIGILAVIALPSVMEALQRREVVDAGEAVLGVVQYAQVQAATRNRAMLVVPSLASGPGLPGSLRVFEGPTSACMNFDTTGASIHDLDLQENFPTVRLFQVDPGLTSTPLCMKPDGRVFIMRGNSPEIITSSYDYSGGDARISLQRINKLGRQEGPVHQVVVPFSGLARVVVKSPTVTP